MKQEEIKIDSIINTNLKRVIDRAQRMADRAAKMYEQGQAMMDKANELGEKAKETVFKSTSEPYKQPQPVGRPKTGNAQAQTRVPQEIKTRLQADGESATLCRVITAYYESPSVRRAIDTFTAKHQKP